MPSCHVKEKEQQTLLLFHLLHKGMSMSPLIHAADLRVQYSSGFFCCPSRFCVGRWIEIFIERLQPPSRRFLILREQCLDICESKEQGPNAHPGLLLERLTVHTADLFPVWGSKKIPHYFTIHAYREDCLTRFKIHCKADDDSAAIHWCKAFLIFQKKESNLIDCIINMYTVRDVDSMC